MKLLDIEITNFRNINYLNFSPTHNINIISGENGQGKTNLLEAIWLLTGSKSFRTNKDFELINKNNNKSYIKANVEINKEIKLIELFIEKNINTNKITRIAKVNGIEYNNAKNIAGLFNCVIFYPDNLSFVKGSADVRRKFIDASLCQIYPNYLNSFIKYKKLLLQKNSLLKNIKNNIYIENYNCLLDVLDEQISEYILEIMNKRAFFIDNIYDDTIDNYNKLSNNREKISIKYKKSIYYNNKKEIYDFLINNRKKDIKLGYSSYGPHKDDLEILINKEQAKIYASQGQQRSIVIALKIAEASLIKNITNKTPILLFDDVLSELDINRQDFLLDKIKGKQVIITNCDYDIFEKTNGLVFEMINGKGNIVKV